MSLPPPRSTLFPYTTLFRSNRFTLGAIVREHGGVPLPQAAAEDSVDALGAAFDRAADADVIVFSGGSSAGTREDRKSTRLNSSHANISYAVFCLKKKLGTAK